jgi:hypothetical protein
MADTNHEDTKAQKNTNHNISSFVYFTWLKIIFRDSQQGAVVRSEKGLVLPLNSVPLRPCGEFLLDELHKEEIS